MVEAEKVTEEVARQIQTGGVRNFIGGLGVGIVVGFYFGHKWNKAKIRAEVFQQAEEEIDKIRLMYRGNVREPQTVVPDKPGLDEIIEERGYIGPDPTVHVERPLPPPVPVQEPSPIKENIFIKAKDEGWDYAIELPQRRRNHPYVIHQDEFNSDEPTGYGSVTWTYYAGDETLVDDSDDIVPRPEMMVGIENLEKFGHGADDPNVVYIRNDRIEMEFEVCRHFGSYESEVLGHDPEDIQSN